MRITDKLQQHHNDSDKATFSFEYFVPKTTQGIQNLYDRMDRMYEASLPQFIDITWNAGGKSSQLTNDLVFTSQSVLGLETCMHLTCTNMPIKQIELALKNAYDSGCMNILALRGDPPLNSTDWEQCETGFKYAKDLISFIKSKYGDHFDIGIAAYPEGHPEEKDSIKLLQYLKEKVDCGANFIITQMVYDSDIFIEWCKQVRSIGIDIPIFPGIMPISTYSAFLRRVQWCEVNVPTNFLKLLDPVKDDDQKVRELGTQLIVEMCQKLIDSGYINHLHFYTMNLEKSSLIILDKLDLLPNENDYQSIKNDITTSLPWRKSLNPQRRNEEVRPIFWQKRPYSYVARTSQWSVDEFPNGRFGDSSSPAFGDLDLCGSSLIRQSSLKSMELWSTPTKINDISTLVINYLKGELNCLPWSDTPLNKNEVNLILNNLIQLNQKNIITINSQPKINGIKSNVKDLGWGPKDGYVYQKEYLEFLLPRNKFINLQEKLKPYDDILTYFAVDYNGNLSSNHPDGSKANAVTWGIFPGREVLQPTIVEKISFLAWKEEFYRILDEWKWNFKDNNEIESSNFVQHLIDDYLLVNIVDNDYISQDNRIFTILNAL